MRTGRNFKLTLTDVSFVFPNSARIPSSKMMEKARLDSYASHWPHDQAKGHSASSKKVTFSTIQSSSFTTHRVCRWPKPDLSTLLRDLVMTLRRVSIAVHLLAAGRMVTILCEHLFVSPAQAFDEWFAQRRTS